MLFMDKSIDNIATFFCKLKARIKPFVSNFICQHIEINPKGCGNSFKLRY